MTIIDRTIFDFTGQKNLGRAYNEAMAQAPDDSHVILRDGDTCWLTSDYGVHIAEYIRLYPDAVLTCWTNRINAKAEQQSQDIGRFDSMTLGIDLIESPVRNITDMRCHLQVAKSRQSDDLYKTTPLHGFVSGFCLIVPKKFWLQHKFSEVQVYEDRGPTNMLGVDNDWTNRIRAAGIQVLRMDGIYIWHTYRLLTGDNDKKHLM